jgi:peptide/nickel transport system substrate-binding protein
MDRLPAGACARAYQELRAGRIGRREFLARATALGVGLPVALFVVQATPVAGAAQGSATPAAAASRRSGRPTTGTATQRRGQGGELKILEWQAPTSLSVHAASGGADIAAASLVTEPLLSYAPDGTLLPTLAAAVPSVANGGLAADLTTVTYRLLPDVVWSDGAPFTAEDVVFTWQWIVDPANQSVDATTFAGIDRVEALDPLTARVTFKQPTLGWYLPFTSSNRGGIYPKHVWDGVDRQHANDAFRAKPIGTGPFVVDSFKPNDQVIYLANDRYREPTKPFFARVNYKGGGDAASAAQAVLQTGGWDFADNVQVDPRVLRAMEAAGKGKVYGTPGTYLEKLELNLSDPAKEVDGQRSQKDTPHPFFRDPAVRTALSLATDRQTISSQLYLGAPAEPPGRNILSGVAAFESPHTTWEFDLAKARQTLDAAGWILTGGVRQKGGVALTLAYVTTINDVRQKTQAVNKKNWEAVGFQVQLRQVDGGVFFDSSAGNDQSFTHFYADTQMYTDGPTSTFPLSYMQYWYAGPHGTNIAQKANGWTGTNKNRYQNPQYDALYEQVAKETDAEAAAALFVQLNDLVIADVVEIPLVQRLAQEYAAALSLRYENIAESAFESIYWNIANWNRTP